MSLRSMVALLEEKALQVAVVATRPSAAGDGVDISSWRSSGNFSNPVAAVFVDGSQAQTVDSPTGGSSGVELWGYRFSQWWLLGFLNNKTAIPIAGAAQGFAQQVDVIGIFERLAVAGTVSGGAATAKLVPLEALG